MRDNFTFGPCFVSPTRGELWRDGELYRLQPKVMEVLVYLAERSDEVVSKERLLEEVWPNTYVTEYVLWRCIAQLRRALDDDAAHPRFIKTLSKRGYQLIVPVSRVADEGLRLKPWSRPVRSDRPHRQLFVAATVVAVVFALAVWVGSGSKRLGPGTRVPDPETPQGLLQQGLAHYARYTWSDNAKAIQELEKASDRSPRDARILAALADAYSMNWLRYSTEASDRRWTQAALEAARKAVRIEPQLPEAHKALGMAQSASGRLEMAVTTYQRAVELRPDYASAANNLAATYVTLGHLDKALRLQEQILNRDPTNQRFTCNLAHTHLILGELKRAQSLVGEALKLDSESPHCLAVGLRTKLLQGKITRARQLARQALSLHPRDVRLLELAAAAEQSVGNYDQALAYLRRATANSIPGGMSRSALRLSDVLWQIGQREWSARIHQEFFSSIEGALQRQDRQWLHLYWAAAVYASRGDIDQSMNWIERAVEQGFVDYGWVRYDPIFADAVRDPRYVDLLDELESRVATMRGEGAVF